MSDALRYEVDGDVARLTLDDGKVNAMSQAFFDALNAALDRAERERPAALVITGRAGVFSAGLDLKLLPTLSPDALQATLRAFGHTMLRVFACPLPTIAAVSGHAIAGGAFLMFACDRRLIADGAYKVHMNEVAIGLSVPSWAVAIASAAVPSRWHLEAMCFARAYTPDEALEKGMIDAVVRPAERLLDEANAAAQALAGLDRAGYALTKRRLRDQAIRWATPLVDAEMVALPVRR